MTTPEKQIPRPEQEYRIQSILAEPTKAALIADEPGVGKTLVGVEVITRGQFERVLIVGVKDTFAQWRDRLAAQSDGTAVLRRLNSEAAGVKAMADFVAGKPGIYFSGSQYLVAQDWVHDPAFENDGTPAWKRDKDEQIILVERPTYATVGKKPVYLERLPGEIGPAARLARQIGPAFEPIRLTQRRQLGTFKRMKPVDLFIFDEVHVIQNRKAVGRATIQSIKAEWKIALSGTPYGNKFPGIWAVCRWLWPELIDGSYWRWAGQWVKTESVRVKGGAKREVEVGEIDPEGTFVNTLPLYIRAEAVEKPPAAQVAYVDLLPEQRAIYTELEEDLMVWLEKNRERAPLVADLPITLRSRLRQATLGVISLDENDEVQFADDCASTKLQILKPILDKWGDQPVVIGVDSKRFAKVIVRRMRAAGYNAVEWSGDVSSKQRDEIKRLFLAEDRSVQYIVAVIPSFSTGLDGFQTVCSKMVWVSESDNNLQNLQFVARIFRPGRTLKYGPFEHVKIVARDTHDEGVYSAKIQETLNLYATLRYQPLSAAA